MKSKKILIVGGVAAAAGLAWYFLRDKKKNPVLIYSNITPDKVKSEVVKTENPYASIADRFEFTGKAAAAPVIEAAAKQPVPLVLPAPTPAPAAAAPTIQPAVVATPAPKTTTSSIAAEKAAIKSVAQMKQAGNLKGLGNAYILNG